MNDIPEKIRRNGRDFQKVRVLDYFQAAVVSLRARSGGRLVRTKDGTTIRCGHNHRSAKAAERCCKKMKNDPDIKAKLKGYCYRIKACEFQTVYYMPSA